MKAIGRGFVIFGARFNDAVQADISASIRMKPRTTNTAEPLQRDSMRTIDRKDMMVSEVNIKTDGVKGNAVNDFIRLLTVNAANQVNGTLGEK